MTDPIETLKATFALYNVTVRAFGPDRTKQLKFILKHYSDESPQEAIHGYRYFHRDNWDFMKRWFKPGTVLRPSNIDKYIDAYGEALEAGLLPPWPDPPIEAPQYIKSNAEQERDAWHRRDYDS
jgi:hypothetical protein